MSRHVIVMPVATGTATVRVGLINDQQRGIVLCQVHTADAAMRPIYLSAIDLSCMLATRAEDFAEPLAALGIELPQSVVDNVNWDATAGAGNLSYVYDATGKLEVLDGDLRTLGPMIVNVAHLHSAALGREVMVALGIQSGRAPRLFSYIGEPGFESPIVDASSIGSACDARAIYSSMVDADRLHATQIEEVLVPLHDYGITVPQAMIAAVRMELEECRGESFTCEFNLNGELVDYD